ncbi:unnamed protein product [Didymodactylos carnosus]|uniref:NHL repeat containing protein n=1 Tax=Didymodactylos carnosus TaxID=1234261 RepID=A0A815QLA4_9BILA|nr:unnamed protein product [Didymodactylos carnosus]CAF4334101.1 unnamed protein product [Didymodactylos carnosus]
MMIFGVCLKQKLLQVAGPSQTTINILTTTTSKIKSTCYTRSWNTTGITVAGSTTGTGGYILNQLLAPFDLVIDSSFNIYISDRINHRIVKWQQNATTGQLFAGDGTAANRRIQKFSLNSTVTPVNGTTVIGNTSQLTRPIAVVLLFTSNSIQGIVFAGGNGNGSLLTQLNNPFDLFVDQNSSTIYIADTYNFRVVKWLKNATTGVLIAGGYGQGGNASQLSNPSGIIVDQNGTIYIADYINSRIQEWPINATQGRTIAGSSNGTLGSTSTLLYGTYNFRFDLNMNLYVVDSRNSRIQKYNVSHNSC